MQFSVEIKMLAEKTIGQSKHTHVYSNKIKFIFYKVNETSMNSSKILMITVIGHTYLE